MLKAELALAPRQRGAAAPARAARGGTLDRNDASALADLQMHWDEAYAIGLDGDIWTARFHGSTDELRAHTCAELRDLIRADYLIRQRAGTTRGHDGALGYDDGTRGQPDHSGADDDDPDSGGGPRFGYGDEDDDEDEGFGSAPAGQDSARLSTRQPAGPQARKDFAGLRGERMST
jgi:hypothetical protein